MGQFLDVIATSLDLVWVGKLLDVDVRMISLDLKSVGFWSQVVLAIGLVGWVASYFLRVITGNMTYDQQRENYENAFLEKRLQEMTPDELEALKESIDDEPEES